MFARSMGVLSAILLALVMSASAAEDIVVVGGEDGYQPYEALDDSGQPYGFNIDLMRAIADEMDFEVRFQLGPWDEARERLESGEIDVLGMFVSESRAEDVRFANPHVIVHHRIYIPAGAEPIGSIANLAGKSVIVQRQAFSHEFLQQADLAIELVLVDDDAEGLRLLARGEHDAALLTEHRSRYTLRRGELENLTVSGPPVLPVEYALAVRPDDDELLNRINQGLDQVTASGEFDRIYERWLQPGIAESREPAGNIMWVLVALLVTGLAVLAGWQMRKLAHARAEKRETERQLEYLKHHDPLSGLLNRRAFEDHLSRFLADHSEEDDEHSLLSINVDQFRLINENFGHARADQLIRKLAESIAGQLPERALTARLGGDEFAVLLPATGNDEALEHSNQLLATVRSRSSASDSSSLNATFSIGIVVFRAGDTNVAQLLRRADCACLAAKEDGGDRSHVWHDEDRRLAEKRGLLRWVGQLQSALDEGRMLPYWQFIMPAHEDSFVTPSVEMLARMVTPEGEVVTAGQFMPAAERYFLSNRIDRWMIDHMLDWLEDHPEVINGLDCININLSGRSLGDDRFLAFLEQRLSDSSALINKLCFEITETALIANLASAQKVLERLHRQGCRFALDDFGIGLSSIGYLKDLPVDYLKIDGSFVRDIDHDPEALEMIEEINRLGRAMGKITVAECVETAEIRTLVCQVGVNMVQGYLFGYPAPLADLAAHFAADSARPPVGENPHSAGDRSDNR